MINAFLSAFEKCEIIVAIIIIGGMIIGILIDSYQNRVGDKGVLKRVKEYYQKKDEFAEQREQFEHKKSDLENKTQMLNEKIASFNKEKQEFEEDCKNIILEFQTEESQNQKNLEFWKKMITENGYHYVEVPLQHAREVITASSTKRKFLKFLKEELPKSNSPKTVREIHVALEELFKDTQYFDYVIEAFEDRANRCNPVLVAFELYICYNTRYDA
ncbi:hypothetical protein [Ligilactobacillus araffinosus]|uniref:Uncharacterized protein n=1 Tax=Ligilactobacillus araffinosus DSM 20653 TaxID=1423820 RepID=A0A0R1ZB34_9LACO|nr:hypothetical protein [Ligilactobacillus araffinosus]KRM52128.1 hypothetical protein FC64_GL000835 [Ligilactobacillus araffinosus DSM 20653]